MTESRNNFPNSEIGRELARKDAAKDIVDTFFKVREEMVRVMGRAVNDNDAAILTLAATIKSSNINPQK
jgi:hypothetical protein